MADAVAKKKVEAIAAAEELAVLYPQPQVIEIDGKTLEIVPLSIRKIGHVAKAINPVIDSLNGIDVELNIARLIGEHTENFISAVSAATGEPEEWVASLPPDDFLRLTLKLFEVNRGFFQAKVAPLLADLGVFASLAKKPSNGAGLTSLAS